MKVQIFPIGLSMILLFLVNCSGSKTAAVNGNNEFTESSPELEKRNQPVDKQDLQILETTDQILSEESSWDSNDRGNCKDVDEKKWSLFCALREATVEVLGEYDHRKVALQEVRFAVEDLSKDKEYKRRLIDFNNDEETEFSDIKKVLQTAIKRVSERLNKQKDGISITDYGLIDLSR